MSARSFRPVLALSAVLAGAPVLAADQAGKPDVVSTTGARRSAVPRTADGRPDLQGMWDFRTLTPFERPADLAQQQVLTDEEAARFEKQAIEAAVDRPPRAGDTGTYNEFWFERASKVVESRRTSLIFDPSNGRLPPLTPQGQKRAAALAEAERSAAGPESRPVYERCILGFNSGPPMIPGGYNNNVHVLQTRDYVVILNEMIHNARIVPLDGRPRLGAAIRQWAGDPRGRWEGDTLVVETANFSDHGTGTLRVRPATDANLRLVERFTRVDQDTLLYEFTVTDPTIWTQPWSAAVPMARTDDQMYEYACHEGNYGLVGVLSGARAEETQSQK